jgi:hypothetical protein
MLYQNRSSGFMSDDWSKAKQKQIDRIKSLKPIDRLALVEAVAEMNQYIAGSCQGWMQWLFNPMVVGQFSLEKLEEIFGRFREFSLEFLELDLAATKGFGEMLKKQSDKNRQDSPRIV